MRYFILFTLLLSVSLFGIERSDLVVKKALPNDFALPQNTTIYYPPPSPSNFALVGTVDTVGGTVYDWQFNGPVYHMIVNDPNYGVHVHWMYSPDAASGYPNRNMRYNFYDFSTRTWTFLEPPYMNYGVNAFQLRTGFGGFHILPTGEAIACAHGVPAGNTELTPIAVKDASPGAGLFPDVCNGPEAYQWPPISVTSNGWIHCLMIDGATQDNLYYSKIREWCNWTDPVAIGPVSGEPLANVGPCHNITSSLNSNNVILMWTQWDHPGYSIDSAAFRISPDGGETWSEVIPLPFPPAFTPGSETLPSFHISSLYGFFDRNEVPHFVASLLPVIRDTGWVIPAEIWHCCPTNTPAWSRVRRADPESIVASVGYNAIFATRPTIGQNPHTGELVCVWEEFIASNQEPATQVLRCAIWAAGSTDNGVTWLEPVLLTDTLSTISFRFPCVAEVIDDTVWITYMGDLQAGFIVQGQGAATENPIFVHKVDIREIIPTGIAEGKKSLVPTLSISPNPFSKSTKLSLTIPNNSGNLIIYDAVGKAVKRFNSLSNTIIWDGTDEAGRELPRGIYFIKLTTKNSSITKKVILSH